MFASMIPAVLAATMLAAPEHEPPTPRSMLPKQLQSLAGDWASEDHDNDGSPDVTVTYRLTSGGSALVETLFPGTPTEMVTMYSMSPGGIACVHYCMLGNQPRLLCEDKPTRGVYRFEFAGSDTVNPSSDAYMGRLVLTVIDEDTIRQEWTSFNAGQAGDTMTFDLKRRH